VVTLNGEGQPIGPDEKTVSEFSSFLGTIGRSSDICPLTFTSWIGLVKSWKEQMIDPVWDYVNVVTFLFDFMCLLAYFNEYIFLILFFFVAKIYNPKGRKEGCVCYCKRWLETIQMAY
jgi:hypothetical protein